MKKITLLALSALLLAAPATVEAKKKAKEPAYGNQKTTVSHPDWLRDAVIYEVNLRQGSPTRDLKGMQRQLPRLKDLGVDVLWLMPVHPISEKNRKGELGSYYAVQDYKKINPEFGSLEDFKEFVRTAHSLGMKVIIDEVCNHTGGDNVWLESNPDFYAKDKAGNLISPFDWTDTYKLDYSNPATRRAMTDALRFWVEETDIDGYRCDVAMEVPTDYWEEAAKELRTIKPILMLAEASKPELTLNAFDMDYNWPMKDVFNAISATQGANEYAKAKNQSLPKMTAKDILALIEKQNKEYPQGAVSMNMVTNHDLNSWEGTEIERFGPALGAFATLSYTLPGVPMMYTGQEVGYNHAFEFFKHDTVPDYTANDITVFYEMLNSMKKKHRALDATNPRENFTPLSVTDEDVIAFTRVSGDDKVMVIANLSGEEAKAPFGDNTPSVAGLVDYFTGSAAALPEALAPWQYVVFTSK